MKINELGQGTNFSKSNALNPKTKKKYSVGFKKRIVQFYLSGIYDLKMIQSKFHISSKLVFQWRKWYFQYFESKFQVYTDEKSITSAAYRAIRTRVEKNSTSSTRRTTQNCLFEKNNSVSRKALSNQSQKKLWHHTVSEVKEEFPLASLKTLCAFFGKTRQAWYKAQNAKEIEQMKDLLVIEHVQHIRKYLPRLGTRKLHHMMGGFFEKHRIKMGRDKLFDLLREFNLLIRKKKRTKKTTNSKHRFRKYPNLIFKVSPIRANQIWVSDITYIRIGNTFSYLSLVMDAYSRKIVGWDLSESLQAEGALRALRMALKQRINKNQQLAHHSDRGIQYCCKEYIKLLQKNKIDVSMTERSEPTENAMAERINRTLKEEFLQYYSFFNHKEAVKATRKAVKYYNEKRPHSSINFLTPNQAHLKTGSLKKCWKNYSKYFDKFAEKQISENPKSRA